MDTSLGRGSGRNGRGGRGAAPLISMRLPFLLPLSFHCGFDCEVHFTKIYILCVIDKYTDWIANKYKLLEKSQE